MLVAFLIRLLFCISGILAQSVNISGSGASDSDLVDEVVTECGVVRPRQGSARFRCCYGPRVYVDDCPRCPVDMKCCSDEICYDVVRKAASYEVLVIFLIAPTVGACLLYALIRCPHAKKRKKDSEYHDGGM